jgi:hypothetical protein
MQPTQVDSSVAWHCKSFYVMALLAAAEGGGGGEVDDEWLEVSGGAEALGRSLQTALIDRVCNRAPPQMQVRPSAIPEGGQGLFALRDFAPGELVLELYGALVPRAPQYERTGAKDYLFGLNKCFQVDPLHPAVQSEWRLAWAINHSCSPNLVALKSNYSLLGFSRQEAAHMRQPMAPPQLPPQERTGEVMPMEKVAIGAEKVGRCGMRPACCSTRARHASHAPCSLSPFLAYSLPPSFLPLFGWRMLTSR